jgi:hypothetical protein
MFTAKKLMEVALSNRPHPNLPSYPQYQFTGQLTASTEVFPTIFLKAGPPYTSCRFSALL